MKQQCSQIWEEPGIPKMETAYFCYAFYIKEFCILRAQVQRLQCFGLVPHRGVALHTGQFTGSCQNTTAVLRATVPHLCTKNC